MIDFADNPWRELRVAWLAENPRQGESRSDPGPYAGCVLVGEDVVEIADNLGDVDAALRWARARADVVMIRGAGEAVYASAGVATPPWFAPDAGDTVGPDGTTISWVVPFPPWDMDEEGIDWHDQL